MKALFSYSSSGDPEVFNARCVTLCLLFALIHFNHKFHEQSQPRSSLSCSGPSLITMEGVWYSYLPNKAPSPHTEIWNIINQWSFCRFSECQAPLHKCKAPLLKTFWTIYWNIYENIQRYSKQSVSLLGFNTAQLKIFGLARLWQVECTARCSNIGCLVDHTSPA